MKAHLWFFNSTWFCSYARDGLVWFSGATPKEAYDRRYLWLSHMGRKA